MSELNESQKRIAETTDGMIVVDAGPGTGKTYTVITRCINIIRKRNFDWHDLVMLTFTKNAAAEMRERLQSSLAKMAQDGEIDVKEFDRLSGIAKKVTVGTFDSFCLSVVKQSPYTISKFFRFNEFLTRKADITENESFNIAYFNRFLDRFLLERGDEFGSWSALIADYPMELFQLLERLMSRGIVPFRKTDEGRYPWFGGDDGKELLGDTAYIRELLKSFKGLKSDDAKDFDGRPDIVYDLRSKTPAPAMLDEAANDDRLGLLAIIHEIYYDYIRSCVKDDHLTFGLVACFAFITLYRDETVRERVGTKYLIVDEFQDTNSNQLMISLLILKEPNLCVVGDWKQGIYGFRFVSIENITDFEDRVVKLRRFLNDDVTRIKFQIPETVTIPLTENYRSSQTVIDAAYETLKIPATKTDALDPALTAKITEIVSKRSEIGDRTKVECVQCTNALAEFDEVLRRIDRYVGSGEYTIIDKEGAEPRRPEYRDIAILCRNGNACRKILDACNEKGIPAFMQGDIEIMNTREGKILLAWLRYISNDKDPWGITSILAEMNYSADTIRRMVTFDKEAGRDYIPEEIKEFRKRLRGKRRRITELISDVFDWYGIDNNISQAITTVLSSAHRSSLQTISNLISTIELDIANRTRYDVDGVPDSNAVIIQTLHKSKGLEYPIVIIPRIDSRSFPMYRESGKFRFNRNIGVRCTMAVIEHDGEMVIDRSWQTAVVNSVIKPDYNEERRLYFVGISRAKQYVTLIAGNNPSPFFEHFTDNGLEPEGTEEVPKRTKASDEPEPRPEIGSFKVRRKNLSVHDLLRFGITSSGMRPEGESDELGRKGMKYGTEVHQMAELYVNGKLDPADRYEEYPELEKIKATVDRLRSEGATLYAERPCALALNDPDVTVSGIMDLMAEFPDRIEVHDWKTDAEGDYQSEYRIQLSVYAHILLDIYPEKKVVCVIDWLNFSDPETFEPLPIDIVKERARNILASGKNK